MFNGKCKIDRQGDKLHARMVLPTPTGPVEWTKVVHSPVDDGGEGERKLKAQARYVAGFFPTAEVVGAENFDTAERLYRSYLDPVTRGPSDAAIDILIDSADHGDEEAEDVAYAARRMAMADVEKIGWGWGKKFFRKVTGAAKSVVRSPIANIFPPVAAYNLVNAARKSPLARGAMGTIAKIALAPAYALNEAIIKEAPKLLESGKSPQEVQQDAQTALAHMETVAQTQDRAEAYTGDPQAYDPNLETGSAGQEAVPVTIPYDESDDSMDDSLGLDLVPMLYRQGAGDLGMDQEQIAGLFSFVKKIGRAIDPTGKGVIGTGIRSAIAHVPGVGPELASGLQLLGQANAGDPAAVEKLQTIGDLAASGVPKAQEALKNLKTAQGLQKKMQGEIADITNPPHAPWKWPVFRTYYAGARSST